jgi:hypothetical protein
MGMPRAIEHHLRHGPQRGVGFTARLAEQAHRKEHHGGLLADWLLGIGNRCVGSSVALLGFVWPLPHHESSFFDGEPRSKKTLPRISREPREPNKPSKPSAPNQPNRPKEPNQPKETDQEVSGLEPNA